MHALRTSLVAIWLLLLLTMGSPLAAQDPSSPATYVTGTVVESLGPPPEPLEGSDTGRLVMLTERTIDWSDPRLPSRMVSRAFMDSYEGAHPDGALWPSMNALSHRLEGPDGAWEGVGRGFDVNPAWMPSEPTELMAVELITLTGDGDYAGLSAILLLRLDARDYGQGQASFEGFIYEGELPPAPEVVEPGFVLRD